MGSDHYQNIATNRQAKFAYTIVDDYEAGLVLVGTEVKSLRGGKVNLKDSYCQVKNGEIFVHQMHIGQYPYAYYGNHDPLRKRKLLFHRSEIRKIEIKMNERGLSLIPMSIYFKNGKIKLKVGLGKGKKLYDKRETIKDRDAKIELHRANKFKEY